MQDTRHSALAARVREFGGGGDPRVVLDNDAVAVAAELLASVDPRPEAADPDVLHTVAAFYWARSVAHGRALGAQDLAARDLEVAIDVFGLLYMVDHRRVPRELWPRLADETGYDPWSDPLDHAADLVVDGEETGDIAALDQAISLIQTVPDSDDNAYRDTVHGLAYHYRAALPGRAAVERSADTDVAVELLGSVAALPEPSAVRRARRGMSLADALVQRFDVAGNTGDLTRAEAAYRDALEDAAGDAHACARAMAGLGATLGRRAEAKAAAAGDEEGVIAASREAVSWLRRAVDLSNGASRDPHLANLSRAMRLLLEWTSRARKTTTHPLVSSDDAAEDDRAARPEDPVVRGQAEALVHLAAQLSSRVVSEDEAICRLQDQSFKLSETAVGSAVYGALRLVEAGRPGDAVPALTLALAAARSRWGTGHGTPWWWAADAYVEAGRLALTEMADGLLFRRACAVADEQISVLRDSDRAEDIAELAETLFAAGLLRVSPYMGQLSGLSSESAHDLWRNRQTEDRSIHPDDCGAPETTEMPTPLFAATEALRYLREAADLSREHNRGRVLKALAEALSMVAGLKQESHDEEIRAAVREAFDLLDPVRDPLTQLYLLRVLQLLGELSLPGDLQDVLPVPLAAVRERQGVREAASVFAEALTLAEEARRPDLKLQLFEAADRELADLPRDS
ncbi:hypothetical protein ACWCOW_32355 [Streptomyces sp. NPDC001939]